MYYKGGTTIRALSCNQEKPKIVVSLTSFTPRLEKLYITLGSIFNQSQQPDKIVLYLGDDVDADKIPLSILNLQKKGLEIRFVENIMSHKKYYYVFKDYPDSCVITIDDDIIYHKHMIKKLYKTHLTFPGCICAMRCHEITYDTTGRPEPYSKWIKNSTAYNEIKPNLFFTSGAGTLFPVNCFDETLYDLNTIKELCYTADDVWLNAMARYSNVSIVNTSLNENERVILSVSGTQEVALKYENLYGPGNDRCVENLIEKYGVGIL